MTENYDFYFSPDYEIVETGKRVGTAPDMKTRFLWRAERRCRKLEEKREVPFYRHEIRREGNRWIVVAMQNVVKRKWENGSSSPASSEDGPDAA